MAITVAPGGALAAGELRTLRDAAGWRDAGASDEAVQAAIDRTWNVTARDGDALVGAVRVLEDGLFYATVWDMLVLPACRGRGIGTRLLEVVLDHCRDRHIVALVATPAGRRLYERAGFATESGGSVGMLRRPPR